MVTSGGMLLHDNDRPHTTARILASLQHLKWGLFHHLAYSLISLRASTAYLPEEFVDITALQK
jgi:hypothetical protein